MSKPRKHPMETKVHFLSQIGIGSSGVKCNGPEKRIKDGLGTILVGKFSGTWEWTKFEHSGRTVIMFNIIHNKYLGKKQKVSLQLVVAEK